MTGLRRYSFFVLSALLAVTIWASCHIALWKMPSEVATHPWFIATLVDAYCGFFFFWMWLAWRENHWPTAMLWLIAIMFMGNMAVAAYILIRLFKLPPSSTVERLLLRDP